MSLASNKARSAPRDGLKNANAIGFGNLHSITALPHMDRLDLIKPH